MAPSSYIPQGRTGKAVHMWYRSTRYHYCVTNTRRRATKFPVASSGKICPVADWEWFSRVRHYASAQSCARLRMVRPPPASRIETHTWCVGIESYPGDVQDAFATNGSSIPNQLAVSEVMTSGFTQSTFGILLIHSAHWFSGFSFWMDMPNDEAILKYWDNIRVFVEPYGV